jgi:hypothetical protein
VSLKNITADEIRAFLAEPEVKARTIIWEVLKDLNHHDEEFGDEKISYDDFLIYCATDLRMALQKIEALMGPVSEDDL